MADRYWILGTGSWTSANTVNWSASSGGAGGASVPTSSDNVIFDANSNVTTTGFTVTLNSGAVNCLDLTASGLDGAMVLAGTLGLTIAGSLSLPASNFSSTYTGTMTFSATSSKTITTNGVALDNSITLNGVGGAWVLQDAISIGPTRTLTLTSGTFNANNKAVTCGVFGSSNTNVRTLTMGAGLWTITGSSFSLTSIANVTLTPSSTTVTLTSASAKSFLGGGLVYGVTINQGGAGDLSIGNGANTFANLTNTVNNCTVKISATAAQTFLAVSLAGTSGNPVTLDSSSAAQATISKASGTVSLSNVIVKNSNATGGATWNAYTTNGNVDGGNNTGWIFTAPATGNNQNMMLMGMAG